MEITLNFSASNSSKKFVSQNIVKFMEENLINEEDRQYAAKILKSNKLQYKGTFSIHYVHSFILFLITRFKSDILKSS